MKYRLKSGVLYGQNGEQPLVRIKGAFQGSEKEILAPDNHLLYRIDVRQLQTASVPSGSVQKKEYVMYTEEGNEYTVAKPDYADGDNPADVGWPICRMPRVDHATLSFEGISYTLVMENEQNYTLVDTMHHQVVQILHCGLAGGWNIEAPEEFPVVFLCGLFIFCRYIEKENEFVVV